eukprot:1646468-Pyramimonas_sp.AAC.1
MLDNAEVTYDSFKTVFDEFKVIGGQLRKGGADTFMRKIFASTEKWITQRMDRQDRNEQDTEAAYVT